MEQVSIYSRPHSHHKILEERIIFQLLCILKYRVVLQTKIFSWFAIFYVKLIRYKGIKKNSKYTLGYHTFRNEYRQTTQTYLKQKNNAHIESSSNMRGS